MGILGLSAPTVSGLLLITSFIAFSIGVATPNYSGLTNEVWNLPHNIKHLAIIRNHTRAWRWARSWTIGSALFSALGVLNLFSISRTAEDRFVSGAALLLMASSAILWIVGMGFQIGLEPQAAMQTKDVTEIPDWFRPVETWAVTLLLLSLLFGYLGTALIGWLILQMDLAAYWVGAFSIAIGVGGGLSLVSNYPRYPGTEYSIAAVPAWLYFILLVQGIALLV